MSAQKSLRTADGEVVAVESLPLPDALKSFIAELDLQGSGEVTEENLMDSKGVLRQLKEGLDAHSTGGITHQDMQKAVQLIADLTKNKAHNKAEMDYHYLPECIQAVMREWDVDGSGTVGEAELAAAANAYKKIRQEDRMLKKVLVGLAFVILLLMTGMFVLSYVAVELAKEMHGGEDGVMRTPDGTTVRVASSDYEMRADGTLVIRGLFNNATCPEGGSCRRLGAASGSNALKVSAAETKRQLTSTLPDSTFKELKAVTLKNQSGTHSLAVNIVSFQRVRLRTSRCGSVVRLKGTQGTLTLDDYEMSADAEMEQYIAEAGMEGLFAGPAAGWGRRLSSSDGLLEGFFNLLDDVEWTCESVELPSPDALPQRYRATIRVKQQHMQPENAYSKFFNDVDGTPLVLPGVEARLDEARGVVTANKTWTQEMIQGGGIKAYLNRYAMHPFMREVRLKRGGARLRMEVRGEVGYDCRVEKTANATTTGGSPTMEFVGVVLEGPLVLRHWRMHILSGEGGEVDKVAKQMRDAGIFPDMVEYYDVDTDPAGNLGAGQPYRIIMRSTSPVPKTLSEQQFLSVHPLQADDDFETRQALELFGVTAVEQACKLEEGAASSDAAQALLQSTAALAVRDRAGADPDFQMPEEIRPWSELPLSVLAVFDALTEALQGSPEPPALTEAKQSPYWFALLHYKDNQDVLDTFRLANASDSNETNTTGGSRRLGKLMPGEEEGPYRMTIGDEDLPQPQSPLQAGNVLDARRLAAARRLKPKWSFGFGLGSDWMELNLGIGVGFVDFKTIFCHPRDPSRTTVAPACVNGRKAAREIVKFEGDAGGLVPIHTPPTIKLGLSGGIIYDDTHADADNVVWYGRIAFHVQIEIVPFVTIDATSEFGVGVENKAGVGKYITELYGKGIRGFAVGWDYAEVFVITRFKPIKPWDNKYRTWDICMSVGYEYEFWVGGGTHYHEWEIFCGQIRG